MDILGAVDDLALLGASDVAAVSTPAGGTVGPPKPPPPPARGKSVEKTVGTFVKVGASEIDGGVEGI